MLDALPENETFDWVERVSVELTTLMLASLFDFPLEDRAKLTRWSDITFAIPEPGGIVETLEQKRDEFIECVQYFAKLWEDRRKNPGDDLVSMLAHGPTTKDMEPVEHLGNLLLLIVGGNDTTRNSMSGSVYGLNKFPAQYEKLTANPNLIPQMVAEIIRWQTPLSYMRRTANVDCEIGGKQIKAGDQMLMWYVSGNRDEAVLRTPTRSISNGQMPGSIYPLGSACIAVWVTGWRNFSYAFSGRKYSYGLRKSKCKMNRVVPSRLSSKVIPACR